MNLPIPDKSTYINAKPFPHCVIDNVFFESEISGILANWPAEHEHFTKNAFEISKGHTLSENIMGEYIANFIHTNFQSQQFIRFLEEITGILGLVFDCRKFALHETFPGGSLAPHLDYTINPKTGLQLRINVLLYLNEHWKSEYNGNLVLYEDIPGYGGILNKPVVEIEPLFNRMVIFTMDAESHAWHGHPKPLNSPAGVSRKSIALNYFTVPQEKAIEQGTLFKKSIWKEILPPMIYRMIR